MNNLAIIQARMGSSRLKGKVLLDLVGKPVLQHIVDRVRQCRKVDHIVVATSHNESDIPIVEYCEKNNIDVFTGDEDDVLSRFANCAAWYNSKNVIRITGDCPMLDYTLVDRLITKHEKENNVLTSNCITETFPDGLDCEVVRTSTLLLADRNAFMKSDREHVTTYIKKDVINVSEMISTFGNYNSFRWTLDQKEDYKFIKKVYKKLYHKNPYFGMQDVLFLLSEYPELMRINNHIKRNEGFEKSKREDYDTRDC